MGLAKGAGVSSQPKGSAMKIKRARAQVLAIILVIMQPTSAWAVFGLEDWISGQNAMLAELVAIEAAESAESIPRMIFQFKQMVELLNETAGAAKLANEAYQWVRDFTWEDILTDAKNGLFKAFPDLEKIEGEIVDLRKNAEGIRDGKFFTVQTRADSRVRQTAKGLVEHGYKAAIWPHVFPDAFNYEALEEPSGVDLEIEKRFIESGMAQERALRKSTFGMLAGEMADLVRHAERTNRADVIAQARGAQAAIDAANAANDQLDLMKLEEARKQVAEDIGRGFDKSLKGGLRKNKDKLLNPGGF